MNFIWFDAAILMVFGAGIGIGFALGRSVVGSAYDRERAKQELEVWNDEQDRRRKEVDKWS